MFDLYKLLRDIDFSDQKPVFIDNLRVGKVYVLLSHNGKTRRVCRVLSVNRREVGFVNIDSHIVTSALRPHADCEYKFYDFD